MLTPILLLFVSNCDSEINVSSFKPNWHTIYESPIFIKELFFRIVSFCIFMKVPNPFPKSLI